MGSHLHSIVLCVDCRYSKLGPVAVPELEMDVGVNS